MQHFGIDYNSSKTCSFLVAYSPLGLEGGTNGWTKVARLPCICIHAMYTCFIVEQVDRHTVHTYYFNQRGLESCEDSTGGVVCYGGHDSRHLIQKNRDGHIRNALLRGWHDFLLTTHPLLLYIARVQMHSTHIVYTCKDRDHQNNTVFCMIGVHVKNPRAGHSEEIAGLILCVTVCTCFL